MVAPSAGLVTTSTPSMLSSRAPDSTASNMAWAAGDGVWCTINSRGMANELLAGGDHLVEAVERRREVDGGSFGRGELREPVVEAVARHAEHAVQHLGEPRRVSAERHEVQAAFADGPERCAAPVDLQFLAVLLYHHVV